MEKNHKIGNLKNAISPYSDYCEGYGNMGSSGNSYVLGVTIGIGKSKISLSHSGSQMLDEINAFDMAETDGAYIGQLNMSIVSSFCGPQGLIWGYDIARAENLEKKSNSLFQLRDHKRRVIPVLSLSPLINATEQLFGTVDNRRFPLRPGAHVPFASKNIKRSGPKRIYAGLAIGIAKDREANACLLMEDIGEIPLESCISEDHIKRYELAIKQKLAESILKVGHNQRVEYERVLVGVKSLGIEAGEIGCALVACPYFTIAQNAVPQNEDFSAILEYNTKEWLEQSNVK